MKTVVKARHMDVTEAIRDYVESKAGKLSRYHRKLNTVEVILDVEGDKPSVEIVVSAKRTVFVASHRGEDMYACVDECLDKIRQQLRRHKDRLRSHQGPSHRQSFELSGQ